MATGYTLEQMMEMAQRAVCHLRNPEDREDAQQEFLLGMLEAQNQAENPSTLKSYEWASGRGRLLTFLRKQKGYNFGCSRAFDGEEILEAALDTLETPLDITVRRDEEDQLGLAIDGLGEMGAAVIRGRFFKEQTLDEIGQGLNVTRERVRQIEAKALSTLEQRLNVN